MEECGMLDEVESHLSYVVHKADTLRFNMTNNQSERFNSLVAKFISGKRIDHSKRGGYLGRMFGASLAHSSGPSWHLSSLKRLTGRSPGSITRKEFRRRKEKVTSAARRRLAQGPYFKKKASGGPDRDYGPLAAEQDMPEDVLKQKCNDILDFQKQQVDSEEKQMDLQEKSRGQSECALWRELGADRLTASNFGCVVRRRPATSCHKLVERLLYKTQDLSKNKAIMFGRQHEKTAIAKYERDRKIHVSPCGIFIDMDHPFLGASPDGLVNPDGIIEVKTLPSISTKTILEALEGKQNICLQRINDTFQLKRNHSYFYQVQGLLAILKRNYCDFVIYATNDFFVERIYPDQQLWENMMLPKLKEFYHKCSLPELSDPRILRGLPVRDPESVIEAKRKQEEKRAVLEKAKR